MTSEVPEAWSEVPIDRRDVSTRVRDCDYRRALPIRVSGVERSVECEVPGQPYSIGLNHRMYAIAHRMCRFS